MNSLIISSLEDMRQFHGKVSHIVSIVDPDDKESIPSLGVPADRHLVLLAHDVESTVEAQVRRKLMPGSRCIAPTKKMVASVLAFAGALPEESDLLVICGHGISRSTALAFAILCQENPGVTEKKVYREVLRLRPQASPNFLIVQFADRLLDRSGKMTRAIDSIK